MQRSWSEWTHRRARLNGVDMHYVEEGDGPLVVLLHGFPQFWYGWRRQIPALAAAGLRVIAPDMRGYNTSGKPSGVDAYRMNALVDDVAALVSHAGEQSAAVVGHDWGGIIAWYAAMWRPSHVRALGVINAPHPALFQREVRTPDQMRRSWYQLAFQAPAVPEASIRAGDFRALRAVLEHDPVRPDVFTPHDIQRHVQALAQPGALTATINYYRAAARHPRALLRGWRPVHAPTLVLWGERDRYLNPRLTHGLEPWAPNLRIRRFPNASHWLAAEEPDAVNAELVRFLTT